MTWGRKGEMAGAGSGPRLDLQGLQNSFYLRYRFIIEVSGVHHIKI